MDFEKPKYSRQQFDEAARRLFAYDDPLKFFDHSLPERAIIDNWRGMCNYPMEVALSDLRYKAQEISVDALCVSRLKRIGTIIGKLSKRPDIALTEMQDISGCRAIMGTMEEVHNLVEICRRGIRDHKYLWQDNYIKRPKKMSGYRSHHLIYTFKGDSPEDDAFGGIRTEIQIRTRLQHLWATAVETIDFLKRTRLKTGTGDDKWRLFFILMSSYIAQLEKLPIVPNTPSDRRILRKQLKSLFDELHVRHWLTMGTAALQGSQKKPTDYMYLLTLYPKEPAHLVIKTYSFEQMDDGFREYITLERSGSDEQDSVLVFADGIEDLKEAYPNYNLDCTEFYLHVLDAIGERANS